MKLMRRISGIAIVATILVPSGSSLAEPMPGMSDGEYIYSPYSGMYGSMGNVYSPYYRQFHSPGMSGM